MAFIFIHNAAYKYLQILLSHGQRNSHVLFIPTCQLTNFDLIDFAETSKAEQLREEANNLMSAAANTKLDDLVNYTVREWLPYNDYEAPEAVEATELPGPIPTLQRLWFGQAPEDKQKRLQAFLSCLYCDGFNHAAIPPYLGKVVFFIFIFNS